jgi:hypothetical protein
MAPRFVAHPVTIILKHQFNPRPLFSRRASHWQELVGDHPQVLVEYMVSSSLDDCFHTQPIRENVAINKTKKLGRALRQDLYKASFMQL